VRQAQTPECARGYQIRRSDRNLPCRQEANHRPDMQGRVTERYIMPQVSSRGQRRLTPRSLDPTAQNGGYVKTSGSAKQSLSVEGVFLLPLRTSRYQGNQLQPPYPQRKQFNKPLDCWCRWCSPLRVQRQRLWNCGVSESGYPRRRTGEVPVDGLKSGRE
jgi:hypothetical protein